MSQTDGPLDPNNPMDRVDFLLELEADGCHGQSERRCVANFLLDVLAEAGGADEVVSSAQELARVAQLIAEDVQRAAEGKLPQNLDQD
jgi:hypothetical protein